MFWLTLCTVIIMVYSRLIIYWPMIYQILHTFWEAGRTKCLVIGIIVGVDLTPLIGLVFTVDGISKLMKFGTMYLSKPEDANLEEAQEGPLLLDVSRDGESDLAKPRG